MSATVARLRIRYAKEGKIRFVGHRDVARIFDRAIRKLRLPTAYSEGFSPRPKISFGLALSVGHESVAEYLDVELATSADIEGLCEQFTAALPNGLSVYGIAAVDPKQESLQQVITSCSWQIEILGVSQHDVEAAVATALRSDDIPLERVRKGKTSTVNVRPAIREILVVGPTDCGVQLDVELATAPITVRPSELIRVLTADGNEGRVRRTHQWMTVADTRLEPIGRPGIAPMHTELCAS